MATSGSVDFSVTCQEIIEASLRVLGVLTLGETISAEEAEDARQALNMLIKSWQVPGNVRLPGLKMWQRDRLSLTLTAKNNFSIKTGGDLVTADIPVVILSASLRNSAGEDTAMAALTLADYEAIGDKSATGDPTGYYYERELAQGMLYLNCVPSDLTKTVRLVTLRPLEDVDALTNDVDFPKEYFRVLKFELAKELAPEYQVSISSDLKDLAAEAWLNAKSLAPGEQDEDMYFQPGSEE